MSKTREGGLFFLLIGFLISLFGFYFKIPYVMALPLFFIGLCFFYDYPKLALSLSIALYIFLPDILVLLLAGGLFAIYLIYQMTRKSYPVTVEPMETTAYVAILFLIIGTFTSIVVSGSLRDLAIHLGGFFFFIMILAYSGEERYIYRLFCILAIVAGILALHGIYQYVSGVEVKKEWVDVANNANIRARVYSIFGNPNIFAEYLIMMIPLTVGLFWYSKRDTVTVFYIILFGIQVVALLMTMSRGGWISLAFGALIFLLIIKKRLLILAIPAGAGAFFFLPPAIMARFMSIFNLADTSTSYRFKIWEITWKIIFDHFFVGVGLGHLPYKYVFETHTRSLAIYHAHNTYLQLFAESGIVGVLLFLFFAISLVVILWKYPLQSENVRIRTMGAALMASFAALAMNGIFENVFYMTKIIVSFWILLALTYALVREAKGEKSAEERKTVQEEVLVYEP